MENENPETPQNTPIFTEPSPLSLQWKTSDTWIGLGILVFLILGFTLGIVQLGLMESLNATWLLIAIPEFLMFVPIAIIFIWRKVPWKELGFSKFKGQDLALGFGILLFVYFLSMVNNVIMMMLGVITQAEVVFDVLKEIDSLALFALSSVILAPVFEELFFRGFLFKGFREKYGWKLSLVLSSFIFSVFHGQVATLIPTFLLGALFAYLYQRTESIFPSMILHFGINSVGTCGLLVAYQFGIV